MPGYAWTKKSIFSGWHRVCQGKSDWRRERRWDRPVEGDWVKKRHRKWVRERNQREVKVPQFRQMSVSEETAQKWNEDVLMGDTNEGHVDYVIVGYCYV
jgi:hypothetical protein